MSVTVLKGKSGEKHQSHGAKKNAVIHPKLMVNAPGDRYEREADSMADRVMRMPQADTGVKQSPGLIGKSVQRKCDKCEEEEKRKKGGVIMRKTMNGHESLKSIVQNTLAGNHSIQRKCAKCEEEEKRKKNETIMRKANGGQGFEAPSNVTSQLAGARGGGSPLSPGTRSFMENAFSTDFSHIRVHTDSKAAVMNHEVNAKAFTYGSDIYFNRGQYAPESSEGKRLLAHELTHVRQQSSQLHQIENSPIQRKGNVSSSVQELITTLSNGNLSQSIEIIKNSLNTSEKDFILSSIHFRSLASSSFGDKSMYELMLAFLSDGYMNLFGCLSWMFGEADEGELEFQRVMTIISFHSKEQKTRILFDFQMKINFQTHFGDREIYELIKSHFIGNALWMCLEWLFYEADKDELEWYRVMDIISSYSDQSEKRSVFEDDYMKGKFQYHFNDEQIYVLVRNYFDGLGLHRSLEWMFSEADEGEMQLWWLLDVLYRYPIDERKLLYGEYWRSKFQLIFSDWEIAFVVKELGFTLAQKLDWMIFEDTNKAAVIAAIEIAPTEEISDAVSDSRLMDRLYLELKDDTIMQSLWAKASTETHKTEDFRVGKTQTTKADDTLEKIINEHYKDYPFTTGNDRRTIAEAIRHLNIGNDCIYFEEHKQSLTYWQRTKRWAKDKVFDRDFEGARKNYELIKVKSGCEIKLPAIHYIDALRESNQISVRSDWKNTAIEIGRGVEGFIDGISSGFESAAIDTVKSIYELLKDIFTGKIFKKAYEIYKMLSETSLSKIWEAIKNFASGVYKDLVKKWENPNPYKKWHFVGEIFGMVIFEILLAVLTAGAGSILRHSVKAIRFLEKFPTLLKIVDVVTPGHGGQIDLPDLKTALNNKRISTLDFPDSDIQKLMKGESIESGADLLKQRDILNVELEARKKLMGEGEPITDPIFDFVVELPNNHKWQRRKDGKGWCRSSDEPECFIDTNSDGEVDTVLDQDLEGLPDDYIGWDPVLEKDWNRTSLKQPGGKHAARDAKNDIPDSSRMFHLFKELQRKREQYLGKTPSVKSKIGDEVIERMRSKGKVIGYGNNLRVRVKGPDGIENYFPLSELDMGHFPIHAVDYWNNTAKHYPAAIRETEVKAWMYKSENYELQHKVVNQKEGSDLALSGKTYEPPLYY